MPRKRERSKEAKRQRGKEAKREERVVRD